MYTQAPLQIENQAVVAELKRAIEHAVLARTDEFLHLVKRFGLRVRQFEELMSRRVFEQLPGLNLSRPCEELFRDLGASDQGLIREFYLTTIEEVPVELRAKYLKLYRYQ